jgi:hypothetical protein
MLRAPSPEMVAEVNEGGGCASAKIDNEQTDIVRQSFVKDMA